MPQAALPQDALAVPHPRIRPIGLFPPARQAAHPPSVTFQRLFGMTRSHLRDLPPAAEERAFYSLNLHGRPGPGSRAMASATCRTYPSMLPTDMIPTCFALQEVASMASETLAMVYPALVGPLWARHPLRES